MDALPYAAEVRGARPWVRPLLPFAVLLVFALVLPWAGNDYWALIATRAAIYWILVAGLNLIVGFAGQLAIGYVALLTLGAYTTSVLAGGGVLPAVPPFLALGCAGVVGAVFGVVVGLPALRLRTFYFAMTTLGVRDDRDADRARLAGRDGAAASASRARPCRRRSIRRGGSITCA